MTDVASGARQSIHAERPPGTRTLLALHGLLAAGYLLGAGVTAAVSFALLAISPTPDGSQMQAWLLD
ncbi:hypothetical protein [Micromonospora sp. NPDC007230]|uniref:hypothetical protein n=1 Tax=Micromonospora sp. NPDC007230 TaxID=3364237 RepID=UPI003692499F